MACDPFLESGLGCCDSPLRISFSGSAVNLPKEAGIYGEDCDAVCTDFEFSMAMANLDSVSADELFCNGKLLPLHHSAEFGTIQSHPRNPDSPKASIQQADQEQKLHPPANFWSCPPAEGGLFAPPSPKAPKCSIMLRDLLWVNKAQVGAIKEGPGKSLATTKLWKHLVRGVIAAGKRGALRSSVLEENAKIFAGSDANAYKVKPSPASAPASSASSPRILSARRILHRSAGRAGGAASADDLNIYLGRKNAFPGRSISMPSSRCSSPRRESAKSITHKPIPGGSERSSASSSGRVNSGKLIMKNLERCSTNQKFPPRSHDQSINGMQDREYPRSPDKVNSYSSNVRVTPVLTVPLILAPYGTTYKLAKSRFSSFKDLFSPKKEAQP